MATLLDFIQLSEAPELLILATLLAFIGGQMARPDSETYRRARCCTSAVFLLYAGMGVYVFGLASVAELLLIIVRAFLAAGVAFGLALVTLRPAAFIARELKTLMPTKTKAKPVVLQKPPLQPVTRPRDYAAEERAEKERMNRIDDAKALASEFFDEHPDILSESLPAALFKTQMHTKFPDNITPEHAWQSAQEMITEMIPLIKDAREKRRAHEEEVQKRVEQDERYTKQDDDRSAVQRITDWYQREKDTLLNLPDTAELENLLIQLEERCDRMIKDALCEVQP